VLGHFSAEAIRPMVVIAKAEAVGEPDKQG
jgi:hypothetical protein